MASDDRPDTVDGALNTRARLIRVGTLVRRPPVTCSPATSVGDAANTMARERISSVLVPHGGDLGILTDRDLRGRVVARGRSGETPVSEVMTPHATVLPASAMVGEAILAMLEGGFHHVPVTDDGGQVLGVLTDTDLLELGRESPFLLKRAIEDARGRDDVVVVAEGLPRVVQSMIRSGVDPVDVGYAVALMTDVLTRRLVDLAIGAQGEPPAPWAWLALGSEARREQGLHSDQDHAIAYEPEPGEDVDPYFASLASSVTSGLEAAGIPRCRGGVMATEPELRRPLAAWTAAFRAWMRDVGTVGSFQASIVFDYRRVAGGLDVERELDDVLRDSQRHPGFAAHLAHRSLDVRPPLGLFGRIRTERGGRHAGTVDIKHRGLLLVTGIARALTLGRGLVERSTIARLRAAGDAGALDGATATDLEEAFRFLWGVRLRRQAQQATSGATPDDHVDPRGLGPVARPALRESLRVIDRAQRALALELGLRI